MVYKCVTTIESYTITRKMLFEYKAKKDLHEVSRVEPKGWY